MTDGALHARFLRGLSKAPDRPAIRVGATTVTFREAHELALLWAGSLLAANRPPLRVGVLAGKSIESYVGILAALYAGATAVPLHPAFPAARTRRMLELAEIDALIVDDAGRAGLPALGVEIPVLGTHALPVRENRALREPRVSESVAYLLFTSGSTGTPKGVPISHASTAHYFDLLDARYDFTADDVFSQTFDLNFDCAMFDMFCAWGVGACVVVVPPAAYREMPSFLRDQGVTVWFSTPSAIALIRRMGGLEPGAMPSLRWSFFAGEALRCQDAADWQVAAPASTLENLYGPTELTVTIAAHRWDSSASPSLGVNGLTPIGTVHPGHEYILLNESGDLAALEGELCITGPQLTAGYLDPDDDGGRFLDRDGKRWYRTGDRVHRQPDGTLVYVGRLDAQVQIQGWRVELAEVEHALRTCDGVEDAVTVARVVHDTTELVVFYTGVQVPPARLAGGLREILPAGMLPRRYEHVAEFPLNPNRKIDRRALTTRAQAMP
ncbi:D-alanine--poly(phosphoribitol) ligase [Amycolatopsis sp. WAC 01375]|uniref:AMP-binding protein n=1 Tax=Amycolatopsis sp. WAC 01375 TaxID=2203194 RepID=UPI000F78D645|nr:AMP-binding protein [Amycolatopsis sp. WAC 01375]RSM72969.1 D-alanine--poly(phosphoribitol) ligase [Amycolatopsis sp. WAC 01375]